MKCSRCMHDSKYRERQGRKCPKCHGQFVFEPREGDPVSDMLFQRAISVVSAEGRARWGVEHLFYELCRRKRRSAGQVVGAVVFGVVALVASFILMQVSPLLGLCVMFVAGMGILFFAFQDRKTVSLDREKFRGLYDRWVKVHGAPAGVIVRKEPTGKSKRARKVEPDIGDYSFDRAVICDRARTVDLLLANNFHFENNCAILTADGYPEGPFETVRAMLKRNPRLAAYTLHDATPAGCQLAHRLATDPNWFAGWAKVIDVGLRPSHGEHFRGLLLPAQKPHVEAENGITPWEASWLRKYSLEVAAIRPEQIIKRLFKAMNLSIDPAKYQGDVIYLAKRHPDRGVDGSSAGGNGGGDAGAVISFDAGDVDGDADSFG